MSLLEMSFQGGVLILITALLRAGMKNRLPRSTFFALWMVVVARLLLPVSLPSACSAYTAAEQSPVLRENLAPVLRTVSAAGVPSGRDAASPWAVLWAVGAIALALYFITGYLHFRQKYRFSLPVEDGFAMQWMLEHPLRRPVSLRQSDQLDTPLTYGILRPVILLPKKIDQAGAGQLSYILAHEMMHIRHFDTVWKLLSTMALCLHWFNPLVWLLCALLGRDLELLCDACVVQHFGESSKSSYAMTLIHMEERKSGLLPFGSYFSKTAIEERISAHAGQKGFDRSDCGGDGTGCGDSNSICDLGSGQHANAAGGCENAAAVSVPRLGIHEHRRIPGARKYSSGRSADLEMVRGGQHGRSILLLKRR